MAELSVQQWIDDEQSGLGMDWEEESYLQGCAYARELAEHRLSALDDELMRSRHDGSAVGGVPQEDSGDPVRRCDHQTPDVSRLRRRDGIPFGRVPGIEASATSESVHHREHRGDGDRMPFRQVTKTVSALTAGVLSRSTVHRLLQDVGQNALDEESERWEAQSRAWRGHE